jgi:hypothetical protein
VSDEDFLSQAVEEPPPVKHKRRRYRKYPRPVCTADQKKALWEHQKGI